MTVYDRIKQLGTEQCYENTKMIDSIRIYELKKSCKETIKDWLNTNQWEELTKWITE